MRYNREYTIDLINTFLRHNSIDEFNYLACTIKVPLTSSYDLQKELLCNQIEQLNINLSGCLEWSDKQANGWHFHFVANAGDIERLLANGVHIIKGYYLQGWIDYITKQTPEKEYIQLAELPEHIEQLEFDFEYLYAERTLITATEQKEKKEINNVPYVLFTFDLQRYIPKFIYRFLAVFFIRIDEVAIRGHPKQKRQTIYKQDKQGSAKGRADPATLLCWYLLVNVKKC